MLRLEVHAEPVVANLLRAYRPDRANRHARESALDAVADSLGLRERNDVRDLVRAGENSHVRRARRDRIQRRSQRRAIGRQRPSIDRNNRDPGAARLEPRGQLVIGNSVFLDRDVLALELDLRRKRAEHFAPGIRLRCDYRGFDAKITHRANRFRAARHGGDCGQRRRYRRPLMARFHRLEQRARPDPGHENDHLEFVLAGQQAIGKIQRRVIVLERHLAHRRRDNRDAAAPLDHRRYFRRHAALEGDDAKSAEAGRAVRGIELRLLVHLKLGVSRELDSVSGFIASGPAAWLILP